MVEGGSYLLIHTGKSQISWSKKLQEMQRKFLNEIYWTKTVVIWYLGSVIYQVHSLELMVISHFMYIFKKKCTRHFLAVSEISYTVFFTILLHISFEYQKFHMIMNTWHLLHISLGYQKMYSHVLYIFKIKDAWHVPHISIQHNSYPLWNVI